MYPTHISEKLLLLLHAWIAGLSKLWCMVFTRPPDDRGRKYNFPMPSLWLSLIASAVFLVAIISLLYWLLITLAG